MNKKVFAIVMIVITIGLLGMVIYIGSSMGSREPSPLTTVKKTKAAAITYSKTINLVPPAVVESTPTPTETVLAPSPTPTIFAPTATPVLEGANQPIVSVTTAVSPTARLTSLPRSGKSDYLVSLVMVASIIIFFSFLY